MEEITDIDQLTELPTRKVFVHNISSIEESYFICILDIDSFRNFNVVYDFIEGDKLLQKISRRLKNYLNRKQFLSRIGGDEFAFVIRDTNKAETEKAVFRVLDTISRIKIDMGTEYTQFSIDNITACAAIIEAPLQLNQGLNFSEVVEIALDQMEKIGTNSFFFLDLEA